MFETNSQIIKNEKSLIYYNPNFMKAHKKFYELYNLMNFTTSIEDLSTHTESKATRIKRRLYKHTLNIKA